MLDHPVIDSLMRTGYPDAPPKLYNCPACGEKIAGSTKLYKDLAGEILGCELCVVTVEIREWEDF